MNKYILIFAVMIFLTGCAAGMTKESNYVNSNIELMQFNSIGSRYIVRPSRIESCTMKNGEKTIRVHIDGYKGYFYVDFYESNAGQYINAVDKFFEWENKAASNKHVFDKQILSVRSPNTLLISFQFVTLRVGVHYLDIGTDVGTPFGLESSHVSWFVLDKNNALIFRYLLENIGKFNSQSPADLYQ